MNLLIFNLQEAEPAMLAACVQRVTSFYAGQPYSTVQPEIFVVEPERDGMLDYSILLPYPSGGQIIVHAIRRPGSTEVEFHS